MNSGGDDIPSGTEFFIGIDTTGLAITDIAGRIVGGAKTISFLVADSQVPMVLGQSMLFIFYVSTDAGATWTPVDSVTILPGQRMGINTVSINLPANSLHLVSATPIGVGFNGPVSFLAY